VEKMENTTERTIDNQGEKAHDIFSGKVESEAVKKTYGESVQYFSELIKNQLAPGNYGIADVGSFKGEFLNNLINKLPEYKFNVVAIDRDEKALLDNENTDKKIVANLDRLPLQDKSVDVAIARYILVWNIFDKQEKIIKEISRVIKNFAIIQHSGSAEDNSDEWRKRISKLFDGQEIPKLKRETHFFPSSKEIEDMMDKENILYEKKQNRKIDDIAVVLKEKYGLTKDEYQRAKTIMGDMNYLIQSTWMIFPKKND
jgi:ubiquinone/menaquinone biosynthesis C-methylase UbiE